MSTRSKILAGAHGCARFARGTMPLLARTALAALTMSAGLYAEAPSPKFSDRILLEFGAKALVSPTVPTGVGGGPAFGIAFRDFNLFLNPTVLLAEPTGSPKIMLTPTMRIEAKFTLLPNFLTLLPYFDAGVINTKVKRPDSKLSDSAETAPFGEIGAGLEIQLTHELSVIPRIGVAYGMVYSIPDSNNHSGPTISLALRYTFGRPNMLDY